MNLWHSTRQFSVPILVFLTMLITAGTELDAQQPQHTPRNEFGQPDMQGYWSFAALTPLQRPENMADKAFMTREEATAFEQNVLNNRAASFEREPNGLDIGYN
ncbi:MAG: hypothetical protein Q8L06_07280, partial [Pseudohongiella sp.]|nr:hypothetical protein [Pseudohongiella sp.]